MTNREAFSGAGVLKLAEAEAAVDGGQQWTGVSNGHSWLRRHRSSVDQDERVVDFEDLFCSIVGS